MVAREAPLQSLSDGAMREESPDSTGRVLGNTQAERSDTGATENIPPMAERCAVSAKHGDSAQVRVKRRGKSSPRLW
jgi:hypothetical protein